MSPWNGLDRRKFPRVNYPCLIIIRQGQEEDVILTHTENIGVGGVGIIFKKSLKILSIVEMELDLLDLEEHIKCQGKVVWSIQRRDNVKKKPTFYDIGIEFVDIKGKDFHRVEKAILRLRKERHEKVPS